MVNTHFHSDHTGGNKNFPEAQFLIGAHDRISEKNKGYQVDPILPGEEKILSIGSETVHVRSMGRGHTWNDVIVYLKNRKLLVTGDLIFNGWNRRNSFL